MKDVEMSDEALVLKGKLLQALQDDNPQLGPIYFLNVGSNFNRLVVDLVEDNTILMNEAAELRAQLGIDYDGYQV